MHWSPRTYLRLFLLVGGTLLLANGILGGELLEIAIGAAAVGLGGVGLASEWRESSV
ncbi:hypothetical protein [Halostagnicola sp. A-GB9-2]|uniref:hypothetical protein n=1 Tax=Halostagnicola sp. A-GB9-2 TaxID=3048066 RepID=UPI0024BF5BF7|nr:hypothetical protein [Halostagnicola sp. A-GB9-2]MDJ1434684.1 hypothetical protein [Halostagnicola sp. A-GB9-2]